LRLENAVQANVLALDPCSTYGRVPRRSSKFPLLSKPLKFRLLATFNESAFESQRKSQNILAQRPGVGQAIGHFWANSCLLLRSH
jgi:hypothetical protein